MRASYYHYVAGEVIASIFPKRVAFFLGESMAGIFPLLYPGDMRALCANLRSIHPGMSDRDLLDLSKKTILNFSHYLVNLFFTHELSKKFVEESVEIRGLHYLDRALESHKGVILASGHFGHWEIGGMVLAKLGYPVHALAARHEDERVNAIFEKRRQLNNFNVIFLGDWLKTCFRWLKKGEILGLLADRQFGEDPGVAVSFLGKTVKFPSGLGRFSQATGALVLPAFFTMKGKNRFQFEIEEALKSQSAEERVREFASRLEMKIKTDPTQWFLFQPFWEKQERPV